MVPQSNEEPTKRKHCGRVISAMDIFVYSIKRCIREFVWERDITEGKSDWQKTKDWQVNVNGWS